jgi:predicted double-glycine peptidase
VTADRDIPPGAIKIELPNTVQLTPYTCGPAALLAIFAYYGVGPEDEAELVAELGIDEAGSDPAHLVAAARRHGLHYEEFRPMTVAQLTACLDEGRPVLLMLQAWADPVPPSYAGWTDGHWVVAIGHDAEHVYFEDPSLYRSRGYLRHDELDRRWHDVEGPDDTPTEHYGVALWKPAARSSAFDRRARRIE